MARGPHPGGDQGCGVPWHAAHQGRATPWLSPPAGNDQFHFISVNLWLSLKMTDALFLEWLMITSSCIIMQSARSWPNIHWNPVLQQQFLSILLLIFYLIMFLHICTVMMSQLVSNTISGSGKLSNVSNYHKSPLFNAKVKNAKSHTLTTMYAFMVWCLIKCSDSCVILIYCLISYYLVGLIATAVSSSKLFWEFKFHQ